MGRTRHPPARPQRAPRGAPLGIQAIRQTAQEFYNFPSTQGSAEGFRASSKSPCPRRKQRGHPSAGPHPTHSPVPSRAGPTAPTDPETRPEEQAEPPGPPSGPQQPLPWPLTPTLPSATLPPDFRGLAEGGSHPRDPLTRRFHLVVQYIQRVVRPSPRPS